MAALCFPDTSCPIHLERIERLDLLRALYEDVRIPPAVRDEFGSVPEGFLVEAPATPGLVHLLRRTIDAGEAEVIALGVQSPRAHLIPDDRAARREAKDLDLTVVGTVGLVLRAKQEGLIEAVRPLLDALQGGGFWISERLYRHALRQAAEND